MIETISFNAFCDGFTGGYKDYFSYEGKRALFDYLEQLEDELGEQTEFDPVALCCEYIEYADLEELQAHYSDIEDMDDLEQHTTVIRIDGSDGFIIQDY